MNREDEEYQRDKTDELMEEFYRRLSGLSAQSVVYAVIKSFMLIEQPDEEILEKFHNWLLDDRYPQEKEVALYHVMCEHFGGPHFSQKKRTPTLRELLAEGEKLSHAPEQVKAAVC